MIKKNFLFFVVLLTVFLFLHNAGKAQGSLLKKWPAGTSPKEIGTRLTAHFIKTPHANFGSPKAPGSLTYPEVCTWYGALLFSKKNKDKAALVSLEERLIKLSTEEKNIIPKPNHVDANVFGSIPFEMYRQTGKQDYLDLALPFADKQWELPANASAAQQRLHEDGLSWQTRMWIDDMFMITAVQAQAYRATGDAKYINRAAKEMIVYLEAIQRPNGLFYHAPDVPFFWGRGNGWMAAGMTELLRSLPTGSPYRPRIMKGYLAMMRSLKDFQSENGMWRQLVDDSTSWPETSATGMFTYAMITGVKKGWLNAKGFAPVARKGWLALVSNIDANDDVKEVCEGTNKKNDRDYYLNRKRITGDMHGQAPVLWCAFALLN